MKQRITALDVLYLLKEFDFVNRRIKKIYGFGRSFVFRIDDEYLLVNPGVAIYKTVRSFPKNEPSFFCQQLRKVLVNARILSVEQQRYDRVIVFRVQKGPAELCLELSFFGTGNIAVRGEGVELFLKRAAPSQDAASAEPPLEAQQSVAEKTDSEESQGNERTKRKREQRKEHRRIEKRITLKNKIKNKPKKAEPKAAKQAVVRDSAPKESDGLAHRLNLKYNLGVEVYDYLEISEDQTLESACALYDAFLSDSPRTEPSIILKEDKPVYFEPIRLKGYDVGYTRRGYSTFSQALDDYFCEEEHKETNTKVPKLEKAQKLFISQLGERAKENRDVAERISSSDVIERAFCVYALLKTYGYSFELFEWYRARRTDDDPLRTLSIDYGKERVFVGGIELDATKTAHENIGLYYQNAKRLEEKIEKTEKSQAEVRMKVMQRSKKEKSVTAVVRARRKAWYEVFHYAEKEDYVVIAGRDATQNEIIVKRYLKDDGVYVHADVQGAASVVVVPRASARAADASPEGDALSSRVESLSIEDTPPESVLSLAGDMALCLSKAWNDRIVTSAFWVRGAQVSKTPESGEYVQKGSFVVRGKKNYLRHCQLAWALGIRFVEGQPVVTGGPYCAYSDTKVRVVVVPGPDKKGKTAKEAAHALVQHFEGEERLLVEALQQEEFVSRIPGLAKIKRE